MAMKHDHFSHLSALKTIVFLLIINSLHGVESDVSTENKTSGEAGTLIIPIGLVLDLNSPLEAMAKLCIDMAVLDFYKAHPDYTTRLQLHTKNVKSVVDANFAALELLVDKKVKGIIGPYESAGEVTWLAELAQNVHVPIISVASQSSAASLRNRYFVRTTPDDAIQAQALAAICQNFQWHEVTVFYEDSSYGYQFLSNINKALQVVGIKLAHTISIPVLATDSVISKELEKLKTRITRIFLVHMSPSLGFRLFTIAKEAGFMSKDYAWLISNSLSIVMNSLSSVVRDTMQGVIGIRPYLIKSKELEHFQERFKRNVILNNFTRRVMELNMYGLWAYDGVTALATAMERIPVANFTLIDKITTSNELSSTKVNGLSGNFQLIDGKLKVSGFEIFNVFGTGEKTIGFWTQDRGIIKEWNSTGKTRELKNVMWPGDSTKQPKGLDFPTNLKVGIPWKHGFKEFVNVIVDRKTKKIISLTGFSIDIFNATLDQLPFPITYEFHYYNDTKISNWSYSNMLNKIPQEYDMVVGDTTIWAPRAEHVDFSLPYSESGVTLVVKNRKPVDMWIFVRPLRWDLWLAIIISCLLMGISLRMLERNIPRLDSTVVPYERPGMSYCFPIAVLAFPERNMVSSNWSFIVLIFWLFMAFILMQSYTANLSAILTLDQLKFEFSDDYYIGWQEGSFMREFLTKHLHISEERLRSYVTIEEFDKAMSLGSKKGGIDAIFDEIPYMKLFVNKYDSRYRMVGPTYITGGFGFAFPVGSGLVSHFSKAILNVTQGPDMIGIVQKNLGPGYSSLDPLSTKISKQTPSLTFYDFEGLFIIIGSVTMLAVLSTNWRKVRNKTRHLLRNILDLYKSSNENSIRNASDHNGDSTQGIGEVDHENILGNAIASSPEGATEMLNVGVATQQGEHEPRETSLHAQTLTGAAQNLDNN